MTIYEWYNHKEKEVVCIKNNLIELLYIKHLITPLENLTKNPNFIKYYSKKDQEIIERFLMQQYKHIETLLKEKKKF